MSASNIEEMSDREILEATYESQVRTEMLVQQFIEGLGPIIEDLRPTIEAFSKRGIMGLLSR